MTSKCTLLIFGILLFFLTSCSTGSDKTAASEETATDTIVQSISLDSITNFLSVQSEIFNIDPTKDTLIYCEKGTVVYLPADCMQFEDGESPDQPIKVAIEEFYALSEIIAANLTTTSGDKILETGGMINMSVSSNGRILTMKDGKEYAIYFPKNGQEKNMQLFYGNTENPDQIDWIPKGEIDKEIIEAVQTKTDSVFECRVCISRFSLPFEPNWLSWMINGQRIDFHTYSRENFNPSAKMTRYFCGKSSRSVSVKFVITNLGKLTNIFFPQDNVIHEYDAEISEFLENLPPIDTNFSSNSNIKMYGANIHWATVSSCTRFSQVNFEKKYASFRENAIKKIDKSELNYYVLTATKFGWINCDKFWNTPDEKIDFFIYTQVPNTEDITIVFEDVNSIMRGRLQNNKVFFNNIPINRQIKVIGISFEGDMPTMSVARTTTGRDGFELTGFNDFTLDQLKAELNTLN